MNVSFVVFSVWFSFSDKSDEKTKKYLHFGRKMYFLFLSFLSPRRTAAAENHQTSKFLSWDQISSNKRRFLKVTFQFSWRILVETKSNPKVSVFIVTIRWFHFSHSVKEAHRDVRITNFFSKKRWNEVLFSSKKSNSFNAEKSKVNAGLYSPKWFSEWMKSLWSLVRNEGWMEIFPSIKKIFFLSQ